MATTPMTSSTSQAPLPDIPMRRLHAWSASTESPSSAPRAGPARRARSRRRDEGATRVPARIVVVDDDEALRNAVRRALRLEGHDVEIAADGASALAQLS